MEIKGTQIVLCDVGTPNKNGRFSIYDYVKEELINRGMLEENIIKNLEDRMVTVEDG